MSKEFEMDCQIVRALQSGEMHNWFVCMRNFGRSNDELGKRVDWIKDQGVAYRKSIDQFNKETREKEIKSCQRLVYLAEKDDTLKDWNPVKKCFCYDVPKKKLELLNLYPVTDEAYNMIKD
jgi:hypothetical protein